MPARYLTPASGSGHGLTLTVTQTDPDATGPVSFSGVQPTVDVSLSPHPTTSHLLPTVTPPVAPVERLQNPLAGRSGLLPLGRSGAADHAHVVLPPGWSDVSASWTGILTPPRSGLYTLALQGVGAATLTLDGVTAVSDPLSHALGRWAQTVNLTGGHRYQVHLSWEPIDTRTPSGESTVSPSYLTLGWAYVSGRIRAAVAAARRADVAVVFAGDFNSEAFDRPSLTLPGDENALIAAVAAVNPHTVVVLNTGGPVLMPWLPRVRAVLEAWYPGEQDGAAVAALLYGDVDPSGRLPVTFPASDIQTGVNTATQWPGIGLTSTYSEGLDVGYRYNHSTGVQPLFPFGYGLSYTRFSMSRLTLSRSADGFALRVRVADTGARSGVAVPQAYLTYPTAAGEPPAQLVAFRPVNLAPHQARTVTLDVPVSSFRVYLGTGWTTVPGTYTLAVGPSSSELPLTVSLAAP